MRRYVAGMLAMMLVAGCGEQQGGGQKSPTRVKVEVAQTGGQSDGRDYVGIVEEQEATAVSFTGMGVVKRVLVSEGQTVGRGQLIAEMDDTQARNLLSGAEAQMTQASDALERYRLLHDNGSLPEVQWVEVQSKVAQAKSQLEIARKNLADCRLTAPVSGVVGRKFVGAGETALPSQAVVSLLDVSTVKVKVSVPETEIGGIDKYTRTNIYVEAAGKEVSGGRIEKGVQADALTHTYDVRIHVPNGDRRLMPGMVASVRFDAATPQPTPKGTKAAGQNAQSVSLSLPVTSVQRRADGTLFVWTVAPDSSAHRQTVAIGSTQGNRVAIVSGLAAGSTVVTEGYQKLSEGTKVVF